MMLHAAIYYIVENHKKTMDNTSEPLESIEKNNKTTENHMTTMNDIWETKENI